MTTFYIDGHRPQRPAPMPEIRLIEPVPVGDTRELPFAAFYDALGWAETERQEIDE